jgi:serine/threonine-protein kinase
VATSKLNWILAGTLAAVLAIFLLYQFAPQGGTTAAQQESARPAGTTSIAVLPFVNLSSDLEQQFFSDGITEEITSALAKVPGLTVIGRTSAFEFKGQNRDLRTIGQTLGATHLIEGSVRKAGNRVRISAQLIQTENGAHLWTENFDRELTDIFAIQESIAEAIAGALRVPLGLDQGQNLASLRPTDQETYDLYLRGRAAMRARRPEAYELLEQVVARDPNFAPGWVWYARSTLFGPQDGERRAERERAARKAIALAPGYAGGYGVLATVASMDGKPLEAMDLFKQALALDPDDPEILNGYGVNLRTLGYLKEALDAAERVHLLEPLIPVYNFLRAEALAMNGMSDVAVRDWLAVSPNVPYGRRFLLPAYAQLGRFGDAIEILSRGGSSGKGSDQPFAEAQIDAAVQVLRAAANKTAPPARLPDFELDLLFVYAYTNMPERILEFLENEVNAGNLALRYVWWPMPSSLRKTERFKTLMRNTGFVDVWRVRGWPDLCRPIATDDFVCD